LVFNANSDLPAGILEDPELGIEYVEYLRFVPYPGIVKLVQFRELFPEVEARRLLLGSIVAAR
jgi:hypothetical protein